MPGQQLIFAVMLGQTLERVGLGASLVPGSPNIVLVLADDMGQSTYFYRVMLREGTKNGKQIDIVRLLVTTPFLPSSLHTFQINSISCPVSTALRIGPFQKGRDTDIQSQLHTMVWYKQCKIRRCWDVKLSPREVFKDTLTTP